MKAETLKTIIILIMLVVIFYFVGRWNANRHSHDFIQENVHEHTH